MSNFDILNQSQKENFFSLNWLEIETILKESALENSFIQKIRQPNFFTLLLDLYTKNGHRQLLVSLSNKSCRLHFCDEKQKNEIKLQRFAQLLRAHIGGAKILSASQINQERIIKLELATSQKEYNLYIRLWSSAPNIFLTTKQNIILDCFYRRPEKGECAKEKFQFPSTSKESPNNFKLRDFTLENYPDLPSDLQKSTTPYYKKIQWLANKLIKSTLFSSYKKQATALLCSLIENKEEKLYGLKQKIETVVSSYKFKEWGELLNANINLIKAGANSITLKNWDENKEPVTIALNPKLSARENIDLYFKKYKKDKTSLNYLNQEQEKTKSDLDSFQKELGWITQNQDFEVLEKWMNEHRFLFEQHNSAKNNSQKRATKEDKKQTTALHFNSMGFHIIVGRSAKENDLLLRYHIRGNDTWIHNRDYAGAYIFIKAIPGKSIPLDVLLDGAHLAIHYSKGKNATHADLYVTQAKYLRRAKDGPLGLVVPTQEKNLHINIDKERLNRLLSH